MIDDINSAKIENPGKLGGIKNTNITAIWGVKENSVMSNQHLTLSFEKVTAKGISTSIHSRKAEGYKFKLQNNSSNTIYLDLTNSFLHNSTFGSSPIYKNKSYTTSKGSDNNLGFGLGAITNAIGLGGVLGSIANGISIGTGDQYGNAITETENPILTVPPHSFVFIPCEKAAIDNKVVEIPYILYFNNAFSFTSDTHWYISELLYDNNLKFDSSDITATSIGLKKNGFVEFSEDKSPKGYGILLTYIIDGDNENVYQMPINFYLRGLFGNVLHFKEAYKYPDTLLYGPAGINK